MNRHGTAVARPGPLVAVVAHVALVAGFAACGDADRGADAPAATVVGEAPPPATTSSTSDGGTGPTVADDAGHDAGPLGPLSFVAVTMNSGTTDGLDHDGPPSDGYSSAQAKISNDHYGNGLAWKAAMNDVRAFFATVSPDVVAFQEIFDPNDCAAIPTAARVGFVCESWSPGDPTVVQSVLGAGYQVACHLGKRDKCVGVKKTFGKLRGCAGDLCYDGLDGATVPDCGGGSRVGRGIVDLARGGSLTVINVHGNSGFKPADMDCRRKQVEQVFVNLGGGPAVVGARNVILGDLNTDPGRLALVDTSAARWNDFVGPSRAVRFVSDIGSSATPSYGGALLGLVGQGFNIDHIASDAFTGTCWTAGISKGHPAVTSMTYFDHAPLVCTLTERAK